MNTELDKIKIILNVCDAPKPIAERELTAWRRNMLGKKFRLYRSAKLVKELKALDLQDAISLCKEMDNPDFIGKYAYQWVGSSAYELMEVL